MYNHVCVHYVNKLLALKSSLRSLVVGSKDIVRNVTCKKYLHRVYDVRCISKEASCHVISMLWEVNSSCSEGEFISLDNYRRPTGVAW